MKKLVVITSILFLTLLTGCKEKISQVCFQGHCLQVESAKTPEEKANGLSSRKNITPNQGMLFIFAKEGYYPFWMKDTKIPLDIIWLNKEREIVHIHKSAQPCKEANCPIIHPPKKARYVLELKSGIADLIKLKIGCPMQFK